MLKFTCLTIGLLVLDIILVTLLAYFHLQEAETVLGLAAINFMSAENKSRLINRLIVKINQLYSIS